MKIQIDSAETFYKNKDEFEKRLRNEARNGLSDNFINFLIDYNNSNELYISEIEQENIRLHLEISYLYKKINDLKFSALEGWGWMQSILFRETKKLKKQINDRSR